MPRKAEAGVRVRRSWSGGTRSGPWSGGTGLGNGLGRRRRQKRNVTCLEGHHVIFRK